MRRNLSSNKWRQLKMGRESASLIAAEYTQQQHDAWKPRARRDGGGIMAWRTGWRLTSLAYRRYVAEKPGISRASAAKRGS
jgi:hypothetical protein